MTDTTLDLDLAAAHSVARSTVSDVLGVGGESRIGTLAAHRLASEITEAVAPLAAEAMRKHLVNLGMIFTADFIGWTCPNLATVCGLCDTPIHEPGGSVAVFLERLIAHDKECEGNE